jgi:anti-sigma B factor antagonist
MLTAMSADRLTLTTDRAGDSLVVALAGDFDAATTFWLEPELERLTRETNARALVVDMSDVTFMDSSALGLLLATQQRLQADGLRLLVANPSRGVRRMLALTGAKGALSVTDWPPPA